MSPTSDQLLQASGVAIVVVLLGLTFYQGALATPYVTADETPRYSHAIAPESSEKYEEYTDQYDLNVYQYDDLSPVGQELVDRTRDGQTSGSGWAGEYTPDVCREFMLVCDEYSRDELPEQFTYGTELDPEEAYQIVEDGDDRYLLRTGTTGHLFLAPFPVRFVVAVLALPPLAVLVGVVTSRSGSDRVRAGAVGAGVLVATIALLAPYVEMVGLGSARAISVLVLGGVWIGILAAVGYRIYQWAADSERRRSPDPS